MKLSVITTVYKSEKYLSTFINDALETLNKLNIESFELIFVLDGITDDSKSYLLKLKDKVKQIKVVELSRNFGHHYAAKAGLEVSKGEDVFLIDCDLEVSPKMLIKFYEEYSKSSEVDVVYGVQKKRKGSWVEKVFGGLFWKIFNMLSETKVPNSVITERLMNRKYVNALLQMGDKNIFMAGLMYWVGFNQKPLIINKKQREGSSSYSLIRRIDLAFEAVFSFSEKPLIYLFKGGLIITFSTILMSVYFLVRRMFFSETVLLGYTSMVLLIIFVFGVTITSIGIMGVYISKIFKETKNRPTYIIKEIL
jgi:putative glycosyltransferase